jgi:antitoxin-like ribbon-helix-helix protein
MMERQRDNMPNRPSLFKPKPADTAPDPGGAPAMIGGGNGRVEPKRPPSREGKRVLSVYLDPLAWKQLRMLALDRETTTQMLGEEAINLLFAKHGINRTA